MLVAYAVNHREMNQSVALAQWILELGGARNHDVLVCLNRTANRFGHYSKLEPILSKAFKSCAPFVPRDEVECPWPNPKNDASSPNHMFKRVSQHVEWVMKRAFLWFEMDAVPLKPNWLDAIEDEYNTAKKPFMGAELEMPNLKYMSGIGIYPKDLTLHTSLLRNSGTIPFDSFSAADVVPRAHFTKLIQFSPFTENGRAAWEVTREPMREDAVLYHRSKTLELIDHLRGDLTPAQQVKTPLRLEDLTPQRIKKDLDSIVGHWPDTKNTISLSDQIRSHCSSLAALIDGKPGRRQMVQTELRKAHLIGRAMKRK